MFDWYRRCAYDGAQKKLFHQKGRAALRTLAKELRLPPNSFDIRSCLGGRRLRRNHSAWRERPYPDFAACDWRR